MNKAFEKILERLDELKKHYNKCCLVDYNEGAVVALTESMSIVREVAEEYKNGWIPCSEKDRRTQRRVEKESVHFKEENIGMNYYLVKNRPSIDSGLHIGKSSVGWRFLFHKPSIQDVDKPLNTFEQWRDYLKEATETGTHVIVNEYDEIVSYEKFMEMVNKKQK